MTSIKDKFCQDCETTINLTRHHLKKRKIVILCRSCHDIADSLNPGFHRSQEKINDKIRHSKLYERHNKKVISNDI